MCRRQATSDKKGMDNEESVKQLEKATVKFMTMEPKLEMKDSKMWRKGLEFLMEKVKFRSKVERGECRKQLKKVETRGRLLCLTLSSVIPSKLNCFYFHG